jgi:peroxiredoxin
MDSQTGPGRALGSYAAARRLNIPERTLRYRASRGRIPGAFKQGKLWKFSLIALMTVRLASPNDALAPGFTLRDASGAPVSLADYRGKVVVLNFWATWCHGCRTEIPWLMEFAGEYRAKGLAVIGVSMDEDGWKVVKPFLREKRLNYPVVLGTGEVARRYGGVDAMPLTYLIDRRGRIAATHLGVFDKDQLEGEIRRLLGRWPE